MGPLGEASSVFTIVGISVCWSSCGSRVRAVKAVWMSEVSSERLKSEVKRDVSGSIEED